MHLRSIVRPVLLAAILALPAPATGETYWSPCPDRDGVQCGQVIVPLDRTGAVPGQIALHVERRAPARPRRRVVVLVAGGPGQPGSASFDLAEPDLARLLPARTLVTYDPRGTGRSALLHCRALARRGGTLGLRSPEAVAACAAEIGPRRAFYTTRDHAEDLEAVRAALGARQIGIYGTSYGTKLALAYALAHPTRVERLLLDSALPARGPDVYGRETLRAIPRVLRAICAGGACLSATRRPVVDFVALANRLAARPVRGRAPDPSGRRRPARLSASDLLTLLVESDLNPALRAALPGAVAVARAGDVAPLLRLGETVRLAPAPPPGELSEALLYTTTCEEAELPSERGSPVRTHPAALRAAVAALPAGARVRSPARRARPRRAGRRRPAHAARGRPPGGRPIPPRPSPGGRGHRALRDRRRSDRLRRPRRARVDADRGCPPALPP